MFARLSIAVTAFLLVGTRQTVEASPITYDFTGTFNGAGINGIDTFSGSFTINGNPTVSPTTGVTESGSEVSLTVNVGGQVLNFDTAAYPQNVQFQAFQETAAYEMGGPTINVGIGGGYNGGTTGDTQTFGMTFYSPGTLSQITNLASLSLPLNTSSVFVAETTAQSFQWAEGTVTSIELVSTPEPSTMMLFAGLGLAGLVHRRRRELRG